MLQCKEEGHPVRRRSVVLVVVLLVVPTTPKLELNPAQVPKPPPAASLLVWPAERGEGATTPSFNRTATLRTGTEYKSKRFPPPIFGYVFPPSLLFSHHTPPLSGKEEKDQLNKHRQRRLDLVACDMAAISTSSPLTTLNPTSTEHDYRFPRRPEADCGTGAMNCDQSEDAAAISSSNAAPTAAAPSTSPSMTRVDGTASTNANSSNAKLGMRNSLKELRFDLSRTIDDAQGKLSNTQAFSGFRDGIAGMSDSPDDLAKDDPLATQIWRYFAKTKQNLPNQERMENLTWRMMHVNLRNQQQKTAEFDRYAMPAPRSPMRFCLRRKIAPPPPLRITPWLGQNE